MEINETLINILHYLEPDEWTALNVILSFFLLLSIVFAYYSLKDMARNQRLNSAQLMYKELQSTEKDRADIIARVMSAIDIEKGSMEVKNFDVNKFEKEDIQKIRNIINSYNRIGLLLENDTISQNMLFSISYPAIVQSWAVCEAYANYYQNLIGVPYARRVERVSKMAKNYFDSSNNKKSFSINLVHEGKRLEIHKTEKETGFKGFIQFIKWKKMRIRGKYT